MATKLEHSDIFRDPKQHTSFGTGPHLCLGKHLARMETRLALNGLFDRLPPTSAWTRKPPGVRTPHITGDQMCRSPHRLPVVWDRS